MPHTARQAAVAENSAFVIYRLFNRLYVAIFMLIHSQLL
jgi:hypothetical protein